MTRGVERPMAHRGEAPNGEGCPRPGLRRGAEQPAEARLVPVLWESQPGTTSQLVASESSRPCTTTMRIGAAYRAASRVGDCARAPATGRRKVGVHWSSRPRSKELAVLRNVAKVHRKMGVNSHVDAVVLAPKAVILDV